jgi:hypothetical protein
MLACDHIWRDPSTGKWDLLGVFEWLHSDMEPMKDVAFEVYAALTGLHGSYDFGLVALGSDGGEVARYTLGARVNAHDPSRRMQIGFCVTRLMLPGFGRYALRLLANGKPFHDLALWVLPTGEEPDDPPSS